MKRKDAFRKLRTICQRLDEVDRRTFYVEPRRLYLFGSALTDKPDPNNIDLLLVYEYQPGIDPDQLAAAVIYRRPLPEDRTVSYLRQGMQKVIISLVRRSLGDWLQSALFVTVRPRLIWEPGGDWRPVLDEIEAKPAPWSGSLPPDAKERYSEFIRRMPKEEYKTRLEQALAAIERQSLPRMVGVISE